MGRQGERKLDGNYEADGFVSVWLGIFPDEPSFERYVEEKYKDPDHATCAFWKDMGIEWFDHDYQEGGFVDNPVTPKELLESGWSFVDSFKEPVLEACRAQHIEAANALMLLFDWNYPKEAAYSSPHMSFVGAFPYAKPPSKKVE